MKLIVHWRHVSESETIEDVVNISDLENIYRLHVLRSNVKAVRDLTKADIAIMAVK